jgi:L-asparagine transporter-like permease
MAVCLLGLQWLLVITGTGLSLIYVAVCIAAIAGRRSGATKHARYRMPLYPFWPAVGLMALAYVFYTSAFDPERLLFFDGPSQRQLDAARSGARQP